MLDAVLVNLFTGRLENLISKRATKQQIIEALKSALEQRPDETLTQFREFFRRAVQHAENTPDYTKPLDKLLTQLDESGDLQDLLEIAVTPQKQEEQTKQNIAAHIKSLSEELNYTIPEAIGSSPAGMVEKLIELLHIFVELVATDHKILRQIESLREELTSPWYPVTASTIPRERIRNNFLKLKFDRQLVPYQPTEGLQLKLRSFLEAADFVCPKLPDIQITVVYGKGGQGKSRLAFELCMQMQKQGWHSGFIQQEEKPHPVECRWNKPSLFVFDYAGSRNTELDALIKGIKAKHQQTPLNYPVRILLLERECSDKAGWFMQLLNNGDVESFIYYEHPYEASKYLTPSLTEQQLIELAKDYLKWHEMPQTEQQAKAAAIVAKATEIEKDTPRPLIVQLVAELLLKDVTLNYKSVEKLLEAFFTREENTVAQLANNDKYLPQKLWEILAIASLAGGIEKQVLYTACKEPEFEQWGRDHLSNKLFTLAGQYFAMDSDLTTIPGMEPDMLGEYLVLRQWRHWKATEDFPQQWQSQIQQQLALALLLSLKTSETLVRLCQDFPDNNPLLENDYLMEIHKQWEEKQHPLANEFGRFIGEKYCLDIFNTNEKDTVKILSNWNKLLQCYQIQSSNPLQAFYLSLASHKLTEEVLNIPSEIFYSICDKVLELTQSNYVQTSHIAISALVNIIDTCGKRNLSKARDYMEQLSNLADKNKESYLWEAKAKGLYNLFNVTVVQNIDEAKRVLSELSALAHKHPTLIIRHFRANGQYNLIYYLTVERKVKEAEKEMKKLSKLATELNTMDGWQLKARALVNLILFSQPNDVSTSEDYLKELFSIAKKQKQESFWVLQAQGMANYVTLAAFNNISKSKFYMKKLSKFAEKRKNIQIWEAEAKALLILAKGINQNGGSTEEGNRYITRAIELIKKFNLDL